MGGNGSCGGRGDRGASYLEYLALGVLAAVVLAGLAVSGIGGSVAHAVGDVICRVVHDGCTGTLGGKPQNVPVGPGHGEPLDPGTARPSNTDVPRPSANPQPSDTAPPDRDTHLEQRLDKILGETALGRSAKAWNRAHGVKVVYQHGGGTYYVYDENTMYVDIDRSPQLTAASYVHESNHARHRYTPDPKKLPRKEFIDRFVGEEVDGVMLSIKENAQYKAAHPDDQKIARTDVPAQKVYDHGYRLAVQKAERRAAGQGRTLTGPEKQRIGYQGGKNRIRMFFDQGRIVQSSDGDTYPHAAGKQWDSANGKCRLWKWWC